MRFLTLAEGLIISEAVTGLKAATLVHVARVDLLDSALHAPQAGFGGVEFYPDPIDKAAVLAVRIARNHPLPDGNKRLAWQALTMFLALNGWSLHAPIEDAVSTVLAIAAGELNEEGLAAWLRERVEQVGG